ncbi:MAG: YdeI/OmpD-associated family protein, partial [Mucilaginibacter sp.]
EGKFILVLNAEIRKGVRKSKGAMLRVRLEEDTEFKVVMPDDLHECFEFEPEAYVFFNSLAKSHRNYFIKWIESAKTQPTRDKRIMLTINAMVKCWDYGQMIREARKDI